jgi:hypothetical protein
MDASPVFLSCQILVSTLSISRCISVYLYPIPFTSAHDTTLSYYSVGHNRRENRKFSMSVLYLSRMLSLPLFSILSMSYLYLIPTSFCLHVYLSRTLSICIVIPFECLLMWSRDTLNGVPIIYNSVILFCAILYY